MQERNVALSIILSLITCGLYGLYWFVCLTNDANYAANEQGTSGGIALLLTIVTCGIYGIYWAYRMGEIINRGKEQCGLSIESSMSIIYLLLYIFGFGIIAWALMQNDLNQINKQHT